MNSAEKKRMEEDRERNQLVQSACSFLRAVDSGTRPDADPKAIELARTIYDASNRMFDATDHLFEIHDDVSLGKRSEEELQETWDRVVDTQGETAAAIDTAAEKLAQLTDQA